MKFRSPESAQDTKQAILAGFEGRIVQGQKPPRAFLDLSHELIYAETIPPDIATLPSTGVIAAHSLTEAGREQVCLAVSKYVVPHEHFPRYHVGIYTGKPENFIGQSEVVPGGLGKMEIKNVGNGRFEVPHRVVEGKYRGPQSPQGDRCSNILLSAAEKIVKAEANHTDTKCSLAFETSQIDVVCWLLENGFKIRPEDKRKWQMIVRGDKRLFVGKELFVGSRESIPEENIVGYAGDDPGMILGVRIVLEKEIMPDTVAESRLTIRRWIASILRTTTPGLKENPLIG